MRCCPPANRELLRLPHASPGSHKVFVATNAELLQIVIVKQREAVSNEEKLEAFSDAFDTFSKTIERLEDSYSELESRFSLLNSRLEETNLRLREALDENENARAYLQNILSSVSSGILVFDCDWRISHYNNAAQSLLEISDGLLGKTDGELVAGDNRPEVSAKHTLSTGEEFSSEEKLVTLKSGREIPVAVSTSLMKDQSGTVIGAVEVIHDLTKIRALEDQVSRVKALAALGEIAATVAHEVRNPLGGIAGFASLLKRDLPEDHAGQRLADKIIKGVENLNDSVTSLLTYAREISLSPRDVELSSFLAEIVTYFRADINHSCGKYRIETRLSPKDLRWRLDPEQFRHAVVNLLHNAIQAMPEGGGIELAATGGEMLRVDVTDEGEGIGEEFMERIFTPFFTTKQGGTGLGLATVKKIVEAHRGKIEVESMAGRGTKFRLFFPM
jgi:PAS domain S-box-containing protein